jgi:hypothetical protein
VIHTEEVPRPARQVKASGRRGKSRTGVSSAFAILFLLAACDGDTTEPGDLRFGQIGELQVEVLSPVGQGNGFLDEAFLWRSEGPWVLVERLSYEGRSGHETLRQPALNPGELAAEYASLIQELNGSPGLRLFSEDVPDHLDPACDGRSRVILTIRDQARGEERRWRRCVDGTFFTATPGTAGPDPGAARVVTAARLARSFTLGEDARSSYLGSLPFATLDRGEDFPLRWDESRVFRSQGGAVPADWEEFWAQHAGPEVPPPSVSWDREMVLVAAMGKRHEAGESLAVRRVLPVDGGSRIELVRRVPGDFCSPAARETHPFHLVVAPRTAGPVLFDDPVLERIPCG